MDFQRRGAQHGQSYCSLYQEPSRLALALGKSSEDKKRFICLFNFEYVQILIVFVVLFCSSASLWRMRGFAGYTYINYQGSSCVEVLLAELMYFCFST